MMEPQENRVPRFITPQDNEVTVYSKSGCPNCVKVKKLLTEKHVKFVVIDCDDYLVENKEEFLRFIQEIAKREYKMFPMVFDGSAFIGGYADTSEYVSRLLDFVSDF
jgi:glutaredoxin